MISAARAAQVREKEADIDTLIGPIEDMYALLSRYEVRVPKEEAAAVSDLRYCWRKLRKQATDVADHLARMQVCVRVQGGAITVNAEPEYLACSACWSGARLPPTTCLTLSTPDPPPHPAGQLQARPAARGAHVCDRCAGLPARLGGKRANGARAGPHGGGRPAQEVPADV